MYTLLPEPERKALRKEYRVRLLVVTLFFLGCMGCIGVAAFFPSYIMTTSLDGTTKQEEKRLAELKSQSTRESIEIELASVNQLVGIFTEGDVNMPLTEFVDSFLEVLTPGIKLASFDVVRTGTSTANIFMSGVAGTRDALVELKRAIERERGFSKIELPVSDLAKSKDIQFSINIQASFTPTYAPNI